jgi:predicted ATPase/transcriptional regulator with XRE-family HTH domain
VHEPRSAPSTGSSFGDQLRAFRQTARLTQAELAERAGLSVNGISSLERGTRTRPYPHTVRALADALSLSPADRERLFESSLAVAPEPAAPREGVAVADMPPRIAARPLPVPATELVGREADLAAVTALMGASGTRLITLTGPGGVGKTRLAVEAARRVEDIYADGVVFVPLAPVTAPAALPAAVARAMGHRELTANDDEHEDAVGTLVDQLRPLHLLLVLDNFEHLADASPAVAEVLAGCPRLTVLVTSRAALRVTGEHELPVPPLALPPSTQHATPADVVASPSGGVFVARARAVSPSFQVTDETANDVAAICWRLAGLPLALELAAANSRLLAPRDLLCRLDQALTTGWTRDLPARQRGLRTTLRWSYELLHDDARTLFRRLAAFSGGFSLDAAEAVAAPALTAAEVLPALAMLVEHSLVVAGAHPDGMRYDLLEPIRQYADELLADDAERRDVFARHAAHYLRLTETAAPALQSSEQIAWLARLDAEDGNVRQAIARSLAAGDGETAARICWAMWLAWWLRGGDLQGRGWAEAALQYDLRPPVRAVAASTAAALAYAHGDYEVAGARWQEALDSADVAGDPELQAGAVAGLGLVALSTGDLDAAVKALTEALPLTDAASADWLRSLILVWLGTIRLVRGDPGGATRLVEDGRALARARGDRLVHYIALFNLAQAATADGDAARAAALLREGVTLSQETGDRANTGHFLEALAVVEGQMGRWERAAVLLGASQALRSAADASVYNYYLPDAVLAARMQAEGRSALGAAFEAAVERGRSLSPAAAVGYAAGEES